MAIRGLAHLAEGRSNETEVFRDINRIVDLLTGYLTDQVFSKAVTADVTGLGPYPFACSFPDAKKGDEVVQCIDGTFVVDANLYFETTITVDGQIQQTAAFAGANLLVPVTLRRIGGFQP